MIIPSIFCSTQPERIEFYESLYSLPAQERETFIKNYIEEMNTKYQIATKESVAKNLVYAAVQEAADDDCIKHIIMYYGNVSHFYPADSFVYESKKGKNKEEKI